MSVSVFRGWDFAGRKVWWLAIGRLRLSVTWGYNKREHEGVQRKRGLYR